MAGGKSARRKGHNFERYIAKRLREEVYNGSPNIKRGHQTSIYDAVPDVETPHFWIECKCQKSPNPAKALEQAETDMDKAGDDKLPVAITKKDRRKPVATMWIEDIMQLYKQGDSANIRVSMSLEDWINLADVYANQYGEI